MRTTSSELARAQGRDTDRRGARASNSASSVHSRAATSATICCASTSSGFGGMRRRSSSPRRTASSSAAHSTSSSRDSGNRRALGTPPTWWLARPARCRNVAIERGEPSWHTRSTSPMSMPSSSEAVAHQHLELAVLQALLGLVPQLLRHAAVMRHHLLGAEQLGQVARGALRHAPRVDEHERRAMRRREVGEALRRPRSHTSCDITASSGDDGQLDREVALAHVTDVDDLRTATRAGAPTRNRAISSIGFCVADSPMRTGGFGVSAASRSSDSARWLPRLLPASAWISSTITVRVVDSIARPDSEPSSTYSDSGVVTTMCGGRRRMPARAVCGVSPVRTSVRIGDVGRCPASRARARMPASGAARLRSMSLDSALSGERRRPAFRRAAARRHPAARGRRSRRGTRRASCRSRWARRRARCVRPGSAAMRRAAARWARRKVAANQRSTAGWKRRKRTLNRARCVSSEERLPRQNVRSTSRPVGCLPT